MPRFFFNIRDGREIQDSEGQEFPDWHAARHHAIKYAGSVLESEADRLALGETWCMEVCDPTGLILFRLDFQVSMAPALYSEAETGAAGRRVSQLVPPIKGAP